MAITFRTPTDVIDQYQKSLEMIAVIQDIVKNPDVAKNIASISKQLIDANTISEQKKKEVFDAEELIAQSKEAAEELEKAKKEHALQVSQLAAKSNDHAAEVQKFGDEKISYVEFVKAQKELLDQKLVDANTVLEEAKTYHQKALVLEKEISAREKTHTQNVEEFEAQKAKTLNDFESVKSSNEVIAAQLAEAATAFELRKKKFEEALKA